MLFGTMIDLPHDPDVTRPVDPHRPDKSRSPQRSAAIVIVAACCLAALAAFLLT